MRSASIREAGLPDDFPKRVIAQARREQHHRRVRLRLAAAACATLFVAIIPLTRILNARRQTSGAPASSALAWQDYSQDYPDPSQYYSGNAVPSASAQLAAATSPDNVSDYLMPDAMRIGNFADNFANDDSDAPWQYDSDWSSRS